MKQELQRIAIAEECGWVKRRWVWIHPDFKTSRMPNYTNDLNAMYGAIQLLCKKKNLRCYCNSGLDGTWECILTESERPNCIPCDGDFFGAANTLSEAMSESFLNAVEKRKE